MKSHNISDGLPGWHNCKEFACQCRSRRRQGFNPWVRKIPLIRKWQPIPVFLPGEFHGQRSLVGYSPWCHKELDMTEWLSTHTQYIRQLNVVQFSRSAVFDSLWPHGLQHSWLPCPSPTPRVYSNSCPLSRWCHPAISFSVVPFSSHLQSFPASGSFPRSQFFTSGGQIIGVSASASVDT